MLLEAANPPAEQVSYCLARATDFDYPEHVRLFLKAGADPNFRIQWDGLRTQLHKAVYLWRSIEIVRMLIDAGGDVNAIDEHDSILRSAIRNGDKEVASLLKLRGARDEQASENSGSSRAIGSHSASPRHATTSAPSIACSMPGPTPTAPPRRIERRRYTGRRGAGGSTRCGASSNVMPIFTGSIPTAAMRWERRSTDPPIASTPRAGRG